MYISQCIIAKNEEDNIGYCLSHLKSVADEQVVVDTGSTDNTVEIAKELGAKVFHFEWINDFSAARNFALEKAKGDWIIFLDCDEYFTDNSIPLIKGYIKKIHGNRNINGIVSELLNIDKDKKVISSVKNISPRIFRNKKSVRYKNKVHEVLRDTKSKDANLNVVCIDASNDIKILHTGYDKNIVQEKNKNDRNISLLMKELDENPTDSKLNLDISKSLYMNEQYKESYDYALLALKYMDDNKDLHYYPEIYNIVLINMYILGYSYDEIKLMFEKSISKYPKYPDYYRVMGLAALRNKDPKEAIIFLEKCIHYCNNYNSNVESLVLGQIEKVYYELLNAYILDGNKAKIVEITVALLKQINMIMKT